MKRIISFVLIAMMIAGVINIVLNVIFVVFFHLHVIGVALATVLSNMFSAGLILNFLIAEDEEFRLSFSKLKIKKKELNKLKVNQLMDLKKNKLRKHDIGERPGVAQCGR